ncbi:MAG: hypothetical protein IPH54_16815 [Rhodoferax sp.]|nr:hypothetical protein [Rhodoferax sp.]
MNIEELITDLRSRVNPDVTTRIRMPQSYGRHQVVKALEYLAMENERLKVMAKRSRELQQKCREL